MNCKRYKRRCAWSLTTIIIMASRTMGMDFFKDFVFAGSKHDIRILVDENDDPLFCANDVGKVLGLTDIGKSIADFDEDEKVPRTIRDLKNVQQLTNFLTELGVYKVVMRSRKENAKPFQKWIAHTIKTIRKTGKYDIDEAIKEGKLMTLEDVEKAKEAAIIAAVEAKETQLLKEMEADTQARTKIIEERAKRDNALNRHQVMVAAFDNKPIVYFGYICDKDDKQIIKIGSTENIKRRSKELNGK